MEISCDSKRNAAKLIPYSSGAQKQLKSASHFVLILARKNVTQTSDYVQSFIRGIKQYEESTIPMFKDKVQGFQTRFHINDNARTIWIGRLNKPTLH